MTVCRSVGRWIEEKVVKKVKEISESWEEVCDTVREWVETTVRKPVETWRTSTEERCVERPCRKRCLCCNRWFCTLVTITTRVVEYVIEVVGEWVFHTVCETVRKVVEIIVDVLVTVLRFVITGFVCIICFCDWLGVWHTVVDFWYDILDIADAAVDLVAGLIHALADLLDITKRMLLDVSQWLPTVIAALVGALAGLIDAARQFAQGVAELAEGFGKAITDIGRLDFCRVSENIVWGLANGVGRSLNLVFGVLSVGIRGVRDSQMQYQRPRNVQDWLDDKGKFTPEHSPDPANPPAQIDGKSLSRHPDLNRADWGIDWRLSPMIMVLSSDNQAVSLRDMHGFDSRLNLYEAGGYGTFWRRNCFDTSRYKLRYKTHDRRVRYSDLYEYIENDADVTPFQIVAMPEATIKRDCATARRKFREMGIKLRITQNIRRIEALKVTHLFWGAATDQIRIDFTDVVVSNGLGASKCDIPMIGSFGYKSQNFFGFARAIFFRTPNVIAADGTEQQSWFATEKELAASYRDARPEIGLGYVAAHELGHCFGLKHEGHDSFHYVMFQAGENDATGELPFALIEYLMLGGEPRFTDANTMSLWDWVVNVAPECLPPPR